MSIVLDKKDIRMKIIDDNDTTSAHLPTKNLLMGKLNFKDVEEVEALKQEIAQSDYTNHKKIQAFKQSVQNKTYQIDALNIAQSLVDVMRLDDN